MSGSLGSGATRQIVCHAAALHVCGAEIGAVGADAAWGRGVTSLEDDLPLVARALVELGEGRSADPAE